MGIKDGMRDALNRFNDAAADKLADLLARTSEKVDEAEARDTIRGVLGAASFAPGLAALIVNLLLDPRVSFMRKFQIGVVAAYMVSPGEALLDALAGPVAYLDDALLTLYVVFLVAQLIGELSEDVIRENWIGEPAQADELVNAANAVGKFLGSRVALDGVTSAIQKT